MDQPIILCVDDDGGVRRSFMRIMDRAGGGFEVECAPSAEAALEKVEAAPERYAVVFADYQMPGMDGVSCLREVAVLAPWATRILVSGQLDVSTITRAVNSGAIFRVFAKPWEPRELLRTAEQGVVRARLSHRNAHLLGSLKTTNQGLTREVARLEQLVLERTNDIIAALVGAIRLRNTEPGGRNRRLAAVVARLSQELKLPPQDAADAEYAALLCGLGRLGLRDNLLEKRPPLSLEDREALARAPELGAELLDHVQLLRGTAQILRGLPDAMNPHRWRSAPLGARLLYAAQRLEALSHNGHRLSPSTWPHVQAELQADRSLDPEVRDKLLKVPVDDWRALPAEDD